MLKLSIIFAAVNVLFKISLSYFFKAWKWFLVPEELWNPELILNTFTVKNKWTWIFHQSCNFQSSAGFLSTLRNAHGSHGQPIPFPKVHYHDGHVIKRDRSRFPWLGIHLTPWKPCCQTPLWCPVLLALLQLQPNSVLLPSKNHCFCSL